MMLLLLLLLLIIIIIIRSTLSILEAESEVPSLPGGRRVLTSGGLLSLRFPALMAERREADGRFPNRNKRSTYRAYL